MKKQTKLAAICLLAGALLAGCAGGPSQPESLPASAESESITNTEAGSLTDTEEAPQKPALPDGVYTADFDTDSSMFHVSEACDGKGTLTVQDGDMTIHISLNSKNIVNLYPGPAADAQKEGARILQPTTDTVTYSDGLTEEVYGFDVPVPALDTEFDLALIGKKGKWYGHKVSVSNPQPQEGAEGKSPAALKDGSYRAAITLEGGSGRASVQSPAAVHVSEGKITAVIQWSSPNYDYMVVGGETYYPVSAEGNSVFEIPVEAFDTPVPVIGDTVAMSSPHEIEYTLTLHSDTLEPES